MDGELISISQTSKYDVSRKILEVEHKFMFTVVQWTFKKQIVQRYNLSLSRLSYV